MGETQDVARLEARALELFDACADLTPEARARRLDALRRSDPTLHAEVVRLLRADADPGVLLQSPQQILSDCAPHLASPEAAPDPRLGSILGAWRIDGLIGSGGMGRVYRASRADGQYTQVVALKCVNIDTASPVLSEVIRNERDMLAMLEHPNIATLLDGGIDAEGCPWFAMQLVQGEAIDAWCDRRRLDLRARVALFLQLCDGLRYAHGKGALHSDLKPSNVLVDEVGRPVLLDFGLSSLTARSLVGPQRQVAMTFGYTAPEVPMQGHSVGSDIYALGVVLRGLLCGVGALPVDAIAGRSPPSLLASQYARQLPDEAARARGMANALAVSRALAGDLDRIVASCLAQDPGQRPESVALLQADLRAWLEFRPVSMRRHEVAYRVGRFLRRHRTAALVASLVAIAAGVGITAGVRLHGQSVEHAGNALAMRRLFEQSFDALTTGGLGQSPLMSMAMLRDAESTLRRGDAAGDVDADVANAMLMALARSYTTLGDYAHAMTLLDDAQARSSGRDALQAPLLAAKAYLLNIQSRHVQAGESARRGLAQLGAMPDAEREPHRLMLEVELARAQWGMAQIEEGRATLRQALDRAEAMAARDPRPLAALLIQEGEWLHLFSSHEAAAAAFERAAALTRERAPLIADAADIEHIRTLQQLGQVRRAAEMGDALLARRRRVLGEQHPETGKAWVVSAQSHYANGEADTAMELAREGGRVLGASLGEEHPETVRAALVIGLVHAHSGRFDEALPIGRRAVAIMERVYGPTHQETMGAIGHLGAMLAVSVASSPESAVWDEVIDLFRRRVVTGQRQGMPMLSERMVLIKARMHVGDIDQESLQELEDIVSALATARGRNHDATHKARFTLVQAYLMLGKDDVARAALSASLQDLAGAPITMATQIARINCHEKLGDLASKQGLHEGARQHWAQALATSQSMEKGPLGIEERLQEKLARGR